jgi:hypothetical protein
MTTSTTRPPLNGVDTPTLFATLDAVKANPELAKFEFRGQPLDRRHAQPQYDPSGEPHPLDKAGQLERPHVERRRTTQTAKGRSVSVKLRNQRAHR